MQNHPIPHKVHHVHHPAHFLYLATLLLVGLVVLFGFITVFIPWAVKDIGVGQRAWAYPFKTCIENTFSDVNEETCIDNDFIEPQGGVPLTGENKTCKAYILATIAFVFISVLLGVVLLLIYGYILEHLWWSPTKTALAANIINLIVCAACIITWIMFIVYAEMTCAPDSIFPVHGYSYGFIMYIFATAFSLASVVTSWLAFAKLRKYKAEEDSMNPFLKQGQEMTGYPQDMTGYPQPMMVPQPVFYPMAPPTPYALPPSPYMPPSPYNLF